MTLACKTADLLSLATQGLNHIIYGKDALRSADERRSALTQLAVTVQAAAKLADVVHVEGLTTSGGVTTVGGNIQALTERMRTDTRRGETEMEAERIGRGVHQMEPIKAKTEKVTKHAEKLAAETGMLRTKTEKVGSETEREAMGETERIKAETEKMGKEIERSVAETGRLHAEAEKVEKETERLKAEAMMVRSEKMKIDAETERVKAEMERMKMEADRSVQAVDIPQPGNHTETPRADVERTCPAGAEDREVDSSVQVQRGVIVPVDLQEATLEAEAGEERQRENKYTPWLKERR